MAEEEAQAETATAISAYGIPLATVTSFKYLGRVLSESDDDWPAAAKNLQRERQKWALLSRVLVREGVDARTPGRIYMVVVQAVMLYGLETWVYSPPTEGIEEEVLQEVKYAPNKIPDNMIG